MPSEQVGIKVGGQVAHWPEGKSLVFDDTFEHEAWNDTDETRVVLFVDVIRPLRQPMKAFNALDDQGDRVLAIHPGREAAPPRLGAAVRTGRDGLRRSLGATGRCRSAP